MYFYYSISYCIDRQMETIITTSKKRPAAENMADAPIDEIKTIVEEMITSSGSLKEKERIFQNKYPHFAERYPMLFKMACKPDFDKDRFAYILQMMSRVQSNDISYDNATKQFGQDMFDTYIKPNLANFKQKNEK